MRSEKYTTTLGAGQGIVEETLAILDFWEPGMDIATLYDLVLSSGRFQKATARRLRNLVYEGFAPRYLGKNGYPAVYLKTLKTILTKKEFIQLLFLYTCRVHKVMYDFVLNVYWMTYLAGRDTISNAEAREFVTRANQDGKTTRAWADSMIERVAGYLTGTLADLGLLEDGQKSVRKLIPYHLEPRAAIYMAYEFHFAGLGDNSILSHPDWGLFGMDRQDVVNELKRQALQGWFIIQSAGDMVRIGWQYQSMEEVINAFTK